MVGRPGFLFQCLLEPSSGRSSLLKSDTTWKFLRAPMWAQDVPRVNGALGFVEVYDATREVEGRNLPEYDDSHWRGVQNVTLISCDQPPLIAPFTCGNPERRDTTNPLRKKIS